MYIEKRKLGNKLKYYLAHSFREGGKVHKIRKYLGANLSKDDLKERIEKAKHLILEEINQYKIIQDPLKSALSEEEIRFVNNLEAKEKLRVFHLSENQWDIFSELFTYNTNAIEGSELDSKEVKEILEDNKWPKKSKGDISKSLDFDDDQKSYFKRISDIAETYGVNEAIKLIRETKEPISLDLIRQLHGVVFKNSKNFAGEFRKLGEEVAVRDGLGRIVHVGAPQSRIISLLNELIEWYNKNKNKYPALILAGVVHNQFENIHPFGDGNGRVGRLLLNNILIKNKMPPVNIDFKNRKEYYGALQEYEKNHNLRPTIDLIIKEYKILRRRLG